MSITAEYRKITPDQLAWFTKKPRALYELLFPDSLEESSPENGGEPKTKDAWSQLGELRAFMEAMQNPGTNDALVISKLPMMLRQWRAMAGEEAAQQILDHWSKQHPAIADHLRAHPSASRPTAEDSRVLNIEKAWDGIHFVLTGQREPADSPISRAVFGDWTIPDELGIMGYGPARVLSSDQVGESAEVLRQSQARLAQDFDVRALVKAEVYAIHDDPQELDYLSGHYARLLGFYEEAAAEKQALAVYMV